MASWSVSEFVSQSTVTSFDSHFTTANTIRWGSDPPFPKILESLYNPIYLYLKSNHGLDNALIISFILLYETILFIKWFY